MKKKLMQLLKVLEKNFECSNIKFKSAKRYVERSASYSNSPYSFQKNLDLFLPFPNKNLIRLIYIDLLILEL